ncbi:hypothetical protein RS83_01267 [Microbacterium oxydans]|uniref:Uncharacterized protein n=2 Tax=Microbacterium oxydans TaxID=82380 RepID=A0A0F0LCX4_9MICO|nr:hypothetical protein RS83_01267 [Microbacterium oxydans]
MPSMDTFFVITGAVIVVWFGVLMWRPRPARKPDPDGFAADPALTKAIDESNRDFVMFRRYP